MRFISETMYENILFFNRYIIGKHGNKIIFKPCRKDVFIMVRIKISSKSQSDVTEMRAKGWHVCIYRDADANEEMVTCEKKDIRFTVKPKENDVRGRFIEVRKYVMGYQKDCKMFYDAGSGINGTLCISEGKSNDDTYAFFRNEVLQNMLDEFGIRRVVFPRDPGDTFEKEVYFDKDKAKINESDHPMMPPFHTDGTYEQLRTERNLMKWRVTNATYIYEYNTLTLTIPQIYDVNAIADKLEEFIN